MIQTLFLAATAALSVAAASVPNSAVLSKRGSALPDDFENHPWIPATIDQDRAPCPALNTLANHGYLPRDGRFISADILNKAFSQGFGIDSTVIKIPIDNAFSVCKYVVRKNKAGDPDQLCATTFNLTNLNEPHTFEHDHSLSREDYMRLYTTEPVNNRDFNRTVFGDSLLVFGQRNLMSVNDAEQIRLNRESLAFQRDPASWFTDNRNTNLNEIGFVFAVMRNFEKARRDVPVQSSNNLADQTVHVDWWSYWFSKERFPTELGWRKPVPDVVNSYVLSISKSVFSATVTAIPTPLPSEATMEPTTNPITPEKRAYSTSHETLPAATGVIPLSLYKRAESIVARETPKPAPLQPYQIRYEPSDFASYQSSVTAFQSGMKRAIQSLVQEA